MSKSEAAPDYSQPLLDAVALFAELKISYALIGGVAAMFYGRPRFTEDVNFVAAEGHMTTLEQSPEVMRRYRFDPACVWKLYHESGVEIDIWKDEYAGEIIARAAEVELQGMRVKIADPHDLIVMNLRAGRLRDDYDISEILKSSDIDDEVIRQRVCAEGYDRFQAIKRRR